ncbi:unannotated protein [freshwater metagenome]|uniref:Unannotated protein n=1 Tax=freshwater metagenome TaxID=449393 RepID=A0A6J7BTF1_9ZZZZ
MIPLGDSAPWVGGVVTDRATCVLAGNPSPMTLEGTNTWVLREPGSKVVVVVDPGPDDIGHLDAIMSEVGEGRIARILLTHGHPDHSDGARSLSARSGAPVAALDPLHRLGDEGIVGGERVIVDGLEIEIIATPGHTDDSLSFHLVRDGALLTGDTVLGRGPTVVAHPEGRLGDYLDSLTRLRELAEATSARWVLPGHGPVVTEPAAAIEAYLAHRAVRLDQVRASVAGGASSADEVLEDVYRDVPRALWPAARLSVLAQLAYLDEPGAG